MTDDFNRPKNIADVGVTFEERLAQLGKLSKQSRDREQLPATQGNRVSNYQQNTNVSAPGGYPSRTAKSRNEQALEEYKKQGQSKQILKVWAMLLQAFDSKMKHFFGEEPDVHFMKFAASLTAESYKRLEDNLLERLDEDREWPPSLVRLRQLANSPTKETMYKARQNLFHNPIPISELDRVELFIKRYKMKEVKSFSDRYFESEFNRKYTQWFREVVLDDMDIRLNEERERVQTYLDNEPVTENDRHREEMIASGEAFNNKFGEQILKMIREKNSEPEELTHEEVERIEQRKLADKMRQDIGDA
ncbi:hypothetical protein [Vibrio agarivorans]|uniref:hypothetical protein n=1 Tax=Vibrio agarivorans TaxID=153622 RepID=UPI0025B30A72|nr:hypothetical protein [Vibrio agarivorans]MDN3663553.1 hypothetical protein [Vibrio agarivorans]